MLRLISAVPVKQGGPTVINMPGLRSGFGNPNSISRCKKTAYMRKAIIQPRPRYVIPQTMIVRALMGGCVGATMPASTPPSSMGNMGKIHAGVIPLIVSRIAPAKSCKYCKPEVMKATAYRVRGREISSHLVRREQNQADA